MAVGVCQGFARGGYGQMARGGHGQTANGGRAQGKGRPWVGGRAKGGRWSMAMGGHGRRAKGGHGGWQGVAMGSWSRDPHPGWGPKRIAKPTSSRA